MLHALVAVWHAVYAVWHWGQVVTGSRPSSSPIWYNFWSGFGSDIAEFALFVGAYHIVRHHNCATHRCWRIAHHKYVMDGVEHRVCKHCHPALGKGHRLTRADMAAHYAAVDPPPLASQSA